MPAQQLIVSNVQNARIGLCWYWHIRSVWVTNNGKLQAKSISKWADPTLLHKSKRKTHNLFTGVECRPVNGDKLTPKMVPLAYAGSGI